MKWVERERARDEEMHTMRETIQRSMGQGHQPAMEHRQGPGKGSTPPPPRHFNQASLPTNGKQELDRVLREVLSCDKDGMAVLMWYDLGENFVPPPHAKARLQGKFGLYPGGGKQPFAAHHFVGGRGSPSTVGIIATDTPMSPQPVRLRRSQVSW